MIRAILLLLVVGCAGHTKAAASATAATAAAQQTGAAAGTQATTAATSQSTSAASVSAKRGARHLSATVTLPPGFSLPPDAGAVFSLQSDDEADEFTAGAEGTADAGAQGAADAGAASEADAGAAAHAGGAGSGSAPGGGFPLWFKVLAGLAALLGVAGAVAWKLKPPWLAWLWRR